MKKIFLFLLLFSSLCSQATQKYVRLDGSNAHNGLTNTSGGAWLTLAYAVTQAVAGDTINLGAGTWDINTQVALPEQISLRGVDSSTTIVKSTLTADLTEIISLRSGADGTNGNQSIYNLQFDGQNNGTMGSGTSWGIYISARSNVAIHHCSFKNFNFSAVKIVGRADNNHDLAPSTWATGNSFNYNRVFNSAGYNIAPNFGHGGLWIAGQQGFNILYNVMDQSSRPQDQNGYCIKAQNFTRGLTVKYNTLSKKPLGTVNGATDTDWTWLIEAGDVQGLEFGYNRCTGSGVDFNRNSKGAYAYSFWIHHDTIINTIQNVYAQSAVTLEFNTTDAIIEDCIFENVAQGIYMTPRTGDSVRNFIIRRIAMLLTTPTGPEAGNGKFIDINGEATQYFDGIQIYNNSMAYKSGKAGYYGISSPKATAGYIKNINIRNNIISGATLEVYSENGGSTVVPDSLTISYNNLHNNGSSNLPVFRTSPAGGTNYVTNNNTTTDPLFVDINTNLRLQAGSTNIGTGTNLGSGIDRGAYQSDVTAPTVSSTNPANSATGVTPGAYTVIINFSEAMNNATLTSGNITGIAGSVTAGSTFASIAATLAASTTYTITVGTGVTDVAGNALVAPYVFSFTTGAAAVPTWVPVPYIILRRN